MLWGLAGLLFFLGVALPFWLSGGRYPEHYWFLETFALTLAILVASLAFWRQKSGPKPRT